MAKGFGIAADESRGRLTHISKVLGLPVSDFYGASAATPDPRGAGDTAETDVMTLVKAHLRDRKPEDRRRFAKALNQLLDAECR